MQSEKLEIQAIKIYQSKIKLKEPFVISLGPLDYAENIVVVMRLTKELRASVSAVLL